MEIIKDIHVEIGNCLDLFKNVPDNSVKLVVTSPPYNIKKNYGKYNDDVSLEEWKDLIDNVTKEVYRVLTDDGSFFLNLSQIPYGKDKEILPLQYIGYEIAKNNNFYLRNMITWTFNGMQNPTLRLAGRYENIMWAVKDLNNYIFNLDDIRIPYITKNDKRLTGKGRNPTDVWYFDHVNNMTKKKLGLTHPTIYPVEMIERIIMMSSNEGDTILDPFLGSGTTAVAAKNLNRKAIGFELDSEYLPEIVKRIKYESKQSELDL
ncbi:DNA-methyltransferase [Rummeliibacillus pycnus]|uniref:DNA-methyltransferase n=1 Tax=Rummeliibacillus pycnus TaxID=101070 RepID=UPI003D2DC074